MRFIGAIDGKVGVDVVEDLLRIQREMRRGKSVDGMTEMKRKKKKDNNSLLFHSINLNYYMKLLR